MLTARVLLAGGALVLLAACVTGLVLASRSGSAAKAALVADDFDGPDRLLTNELAYRGRDAHGVPRSATWTVTSGSWFIRDGQAWTGPPDGERPDSRSRAHNDSAVLRVLSKARSLHDVAVTFTLTNEGMTTTARTPAVAHDGVHVFVRYRGEAELYAVSVNRRDGAVVIRKKVPGGTQNGGTYYDVGRRARRPIPFGDRQRVAVRVRDESDGSVGFRVRMDGRTVLAARDAGVGGPPLRGGGRIGIRGDNDNFLVDDLRVEALR
jgi:hypothetical protein